MENVNEIKKILDNIEIQVQKCRVILDGGSLSPADETDFAIKAAKVAKIEETGQETIIEGVFDGEKMIGPDGKQYSVPANYISKSKLVEGDILKLTIDEAGNFVYKQIGPVDRARLIGKIIKEEATGEFRVLADKKVYKVILASVTYFKGGEGDEAVILVPKGVESQWAAVENIIGKAK